MVSDSPLTTSIRPAASHLPLTPRETDLTLPVCSCTLRPTHVQVRKKKKPNTIYRAHLVLSVWGPEKNGRRHNHVFS